jgi:tRNA pseudouridine65 synthase
MKRLPLPVLAQGEGWLVIGKPSGLLVHRSSLAADRLAALQWVRDDLGRRVYTVHRIDRAASGCVLFGWDKTIAPALNAALRDEVAEKWYLALVRGEIQPGASTTINSEMDNRPARTDVTVLASMPDPRCSLVLCRIFTGRFHQIRRHLARIGHPLLGDSRHGDTKINRQWREDRALPRLMLHAWRFETSHPDIGHISARCPPWPDFARTLRALPLWEPAVAALPELAEGWTTPPPWPEPPPNDPQARRRLEGRGGAPEDEDPPGDDDDLPAPEDDGVDFG